MKCKHKNNLWRQYYEKMSNPDSIFSASYLVQDTINKLSTDENIREMPIAEPKFQTQFKESTNISPLSTDFHEKHPLFDAPLCVDEIDPLNSGKIFFSDENHDDESYDHSILVKPDANCHKDSQNNFDSPKKKKISSSDSIALDQGNYPEWKQFSLPSTNFPDDSKVEDEILSQFEISKLLDQIRAND